MLLFLKLQEDMENYIRFKLVGGHFKKIKPNIVPHIFDCQPGRKRLSIHASRPVAVKRARRRIVDEAIASFSMIQDRGLNQNDLQIDVTNNDIWEEYTDIPDLLKKEYEEQPCDIDIQHNGIQETVFVKKEVEVDDEELCDVDTKSSVLIKFEQENDDEIW